ncbi:MAG TPA: nitroreductase/quinone reductase family protein [Candidatus Binatia bacterium]|nr:nitroreductase/quinone reductase family protein [Candidatus Binatia bacterium]
MDVLLTTTGRRTGTPRTVRLYAFADGDRLVVVGSRGGDVRDPYWAENLRADPRATVTIGGEEHELRATEVGTDDRERLWALVQAEFPTYAYYQRRTKRVIPLFVLGPLDGGATTTEARD